MAWLKAEAINAEPIVDSDTLLFAASLNFCQLLNGPTFVARSGKTTDFRCKSWKKAMPLCSGLFPCGVGCDCVLAEGAASGTPDWLCCATPTEHAKQQTATAETRHRTPVRCFDLPFFRPELKTRPRDIPDDSIAAAGWQLHRRIWASILHATDDAPGSVSSLMSGRQRLAKIVRSNHPMGL